MIDSRIPLMGQQQADPFESATKGIQFGQGLRQLLMGRQAGNMAALKPEERQDFANNSMFSRELNAQIKADAAAQEKAMYDRLKTEAEISKIGSEAYKNNQQGGGYALDNSGKKQAAIQGVIQQAAMSGDSGQVLIGLSRLAKTGLITPEQFQQETAIVKTMTPEELLKYAQGVALTDKEVAPYLYQTKDNFATNATSRANTKDTVGAQKEIADADRVSNDAYRMQQLRVQQNEGQIVNAADGKSYIFYPSLNKYEPMLDQNGQHVAKTSDQKAINEESKRIQRVETLTPEIRKLLGGNGATGSFIGTGADWLGRTIGYSTKGSETTAQLKTLSGQLVALMPRMEGPQSNIDVEMYKEMAGNVADPTLPINTRLAALSSIENLNEKYKNLNQGVQPPQEQKGVPYANAGQQPVSHKGSRASLSEVNQAAQQAGISTEQMVSILKGQGVIIK